MVRNPRWICWEASAAAGPWNPDLLADYVRRSANFEERETERADRDATWCRYSSSSSIFTPLHLSKASLIRLLWKQCLIALFLHLSLFTSKYLPLPKTNTQCIWENGSNKVSGIRNRLTRRWKIKRAYGGKKSNSQKEMLQFPSESKIDDSRGGEWPCSMDEASKQPLNHSPNKPIVAHLACEGMLANPKGIAGPLATRVRGAWKREQARTRGWTRRERTWIGP